MSVLLKTNHRQRAYRRGVSLLEVLVSIGVTSVGLLGVMALIPLGGAQARQGQVYERAANMGVAAMGEIRARDMLNPTRVLTKQTDGTFVNFPIATLPTTSFCLDPIGIAAGTNRLFPSSTNCVSPMIRLTLNDGVSGPTTPMSAPMANAIFRSADDLTLKIDQEDRSLPAGQLWNQDPENTTNVIRRQSEGTMSWMVTASPNLAHGATGSNNLWTVSIVVFNRRIVDATLPTEFTSLPLDPTNDFPGGGVSGGDVVLNFATADEAKEAKTPENSWLMLSGQAGATFVYQWYRVLGSDATSDTERQVTLAGPDWKTSLTNTQATIIPGTVAVYQENMRLETGKGTSLWR